MELYFGEIQQAVKGFNIQKKIIRIMAGVEKRVSCKEVFEELQWLA
jgi:hypothetical protein